jgi:hypothetical protein
VVRDAYLIGFTLALTPDLSPGEREKLYHATSERRVCDLIQSRIFPSFETLAKIEINDSGT